MSFFQSIEGMDEWMKEKIKNSVRVWVSERVSEYGSRNTFMWVKVENRKISHRIDKQYFFLYTMNTVEEDFLHELNLPFR